MKVLCCTYSNHNNNLQISEKVSGSRFDSSQEENMQKRGADVYQIK
jgi:hypothetical protein